MPAEVRTDQNMRVTMENMFKVWKKNNPEEVPVFFKKIDTIRKGLLHPLGMSQRGLFLHKSETPNGINRLMTHVFGRHWRSDPEIMSCFYSVFKGFQINQTSRPKMTTHRPTVKDGYQLEEDVWRDFQMKAMMEHNIIVR